MQIEWFGQSAFRLMAPEGVVFIDPFGDLSGHVRWDYPPIAGVDAGLLLVTHEHRDHNEIAAIGGEPQILRSTAGRLASPIGEVVAVASEHDDAAGTKRGPNTIFVFDLGGLRIAHLGDFGQAALRPEQAAAIGTVDLAFLPVGGGPTIGGEQATTIAAQIGARWVVPMHYRTARIDFLDPIDGFLEEIVDVYMAGAARIDSERLPAAATAPLAVVLDAP